MATSADRAPTTASTAGDDPRLSVRRPPSASGSVDGAWWPRTDVLADELGTLLPAFWATGQPVNRIAYHVGAWSPAPRRTLVDGRTIRLGGFSVGDPNTVLLTDAWGRVRIDLLVIPPSTDTAAAEHLMAVAARGDNTRTAAQLLADEGAGA